MPERTLSGNNLHLEDCHWQSNFFYQPHCFCLGVGTGEALGFGEVPFVGHKGNALLKDSPHLIRPQNVENERVSLPVVSATLWVIFLAHCTSYSPLNPVGSGWPKVRGSVE